MLLINLQDKINEAAPIGRLVLPEGQIEITAPVTIPSDFVLEGNNTQIIVNFADDYAFRIEGSEIKRAQVLTDITPTTLTSILEVSDATGFSVGDKIAISTEASLSQKAVFNTIEAISGNQISLKNNFYLEHPSNQPIQIIKYQPNTNVTLQDLTITGGAGFKTFGIFARFTADLTISNVTVENIAVTPVHIEFSTFPVVCDSTFRLNGRAGQGDHSVGMVFCAHGIIRNNTLKEGGGLYVKGSENVTCSDNRLQDVGVTGGGGVNFVSTFGSTIRSNSLSNTASYGVWLLSGSQNNNISGNHIADCLSSGIYLGSEVDNASLPIDFNTIINNTCMSSRGGNGIFVTAVGGHNLISLNQTSRNQARGIIAHGSNNIITNNISTRNGLDNIKIAGKGNKARDNIKVATSTPITVEKGNSDPIELVNKASERVQRSRSIFSFFRRSQPQSSHPHAVKDDLKATI